MHCMYMKECNAVFCGTGTIFSKVKMTAEDSNRPIAQKASLRFIDNVIPTSNSNDINKYVKLLNGMVFQHQEKLITLNKAEAVSVTWLISSMHEGNVYFKYNLMPG